ncbi:MAG: replicative DNA helicase [Rickettsiaceae bacterium]|nr:MAG: replicative DNA helicase [Rickettsiaceae bacterium]
MINHVDLIPTRTVPCNVQAEQMLLGAVLTNPELLNQVTEFLRSEHFYEKIHQSIYNSIEVITEKGFTATPITLKSMLDKHQSFQEVGGIEYLNKLATLAMIVINPYDYGRIIYDLAVKRDLIKIGEDIVNVAYASTIENDSAKQIEQAESKLYGLASEGISEKGFIKINDSIADSLKSINRAMKSSDHVIGISTGLAELDTKLSGWHNSDLIIMAGRPSMGKTAFAINFALNACKSLKMKNKSEDLVPSVGFFSLEMSSEQLASRLLSMYTKIDSSALRSGKVSEEHYNDLRRAASEISNLPLFIDDTPALSISAIRTRARKLKRKSNLGMLFIDYLQLIKGSSKSDNRVLEISEITQGLKAIAKELNIPVIALSQLSRAVEQRDDKRPMLSDLRESGSIEQDADIVMFLYREEYYLSRKEPPPGDAKHAEWQSKLDEVHNITDIIVAKHRNGPVGNVQIFYDSRYSKISNLHKMHNN